MIDTFGEHEAGGAATQGIRGGKCRKVQLVKAPDGSISYRPLLKVKGMQCDLGEHGTEREAAIAYDVCKLKVATEHGLDSTALKLNSDPATYASHPIFQYLLHECTLDEACRLLREGLVEEFLEKERPRRLGAWRRAAAGGAAAAEAVGAGSSAEEEGGGNKWDHSPVELITGSASPSPAQQRQGQGQQCPDVETAPGAAQPVATGSPAPPSSCPSPPSSAGEEGSAPARLRSMWTEEPAGSGRYLVNVTQRLIRMRELCLPAMVRQGLFGEATHGSTITIRSATEDDRWLADYVEYARSGMRVDAFLRQLQSLVKDAALAPHEVLAFRHLDSLTLSLEVHRVGSQVALDYIKSITDLASLPTGPSKPSPASGGSLPSSRKRTAPSSLAGQSGGAAAAPKRLRGAGTAAAAAAAAEAAAEVTAWPGGKENAGAQPMPPVATGQLGDTAVDRLVLSRRQHKLLPPAPGDHTSPAAPLKVVEIDGAAAKPAEKQGAAKAAVGAAGTGKAKNTKPAARAAVAAAKLASKTAKAGIATATTAVKAKPSGVRTPASAAKQPTTKPKTSWAQFPVGTGAHSVVLSEAACRNSNLNVTVYRAGQVFGAVQAPAEVTVTSTDTGKQHRWTYRQYNSSNNQVYLHALTEYMHSVKANPGDVLSLKPLHQGCAEVTLWARSSKEAKAFVAHLHSGKADESPPIKKAPSLQAGQGATPPAATQAATPPAFSQKPAANRTQQQQQQPGGSAITRLHSRSRSPPIVAAAAAAAEEEPPTKAAGPSVAGKTATSPASAKKPGADKPPSSSAITRIRCRTPLAVEAAGAAEAASGSKRNAAGKQQALDQVASGTEVPPCANAAAGAAQPSALPKVPWILARQAGVAAAAGIKASSSLSKAAPGDGPAAAADPLAAAAKVSQRAAAVLPMPKAPEASAKAITGPAHSPAATAAEPTAASAAKPPVPKPAAAPTKPKPTPSTVHPAVAEAPAVAAPVPAKSALPARQAQHAQRGGGVRRGGWRGGAARPAALAGSKRRKQPSPSRAAEGDPNTTAYAEAVMTTSKRPRSPNSPGAPAWAPGAAIFAAAAASAGNGGVAPTKPSTSMWSDSMETGSASLALEGAGGWWGARQSALAPPPSQQAAQTTAPAMSAFSMQGPRAQQAQQPLAAPAELLQDEQGVWANMKKLMDYVVAEGRLTLAEAAAFQCGFAQIRDPGARWFNYSGMKQLYESAEWEQLVSWARKVRAGQA